MMQDKVEMSVKKEVLNFQKRKKIYDTILSKPGLHLRDLERNVDLPLGILRYHLNYLKKTGLVNALKDGGFSRYFVKNGVGNEDKILVEVFRQKTLRKILIIFLLCEDKTVFFNDDLRHLPFVRKWYNPQKSVILKHRTTLDFHLKKLVNFGTIEVVKGYRKKGYRLVNSDKIWDFLLRYDDALSYDELHDLLLCTDKFVVSEVTDPVLDFIFDVFPHPYHV